MEYENKKVLHKCPACNSNIPVINKICEYCGFEFLDSADSELSSEILISKIQFSFELMKKNMKTDFFKIVIQNSYIIFPLLVFYFFFLSWTNGHSSIFFYCLLIFSALSVISILIKLIMVLKKTDKKKNPQRFRADYEKYMRIIHSFYGSKTEIHQLLDNFNSEYSVLVNKKSKSSTNSFLIFAFLFITCVFLGIYTFANYNDTQIYRSETKSINDISLTKINLQTDELTGPLKDFIKLVPSTYYGWYDVFSSIEYSKFTISDVKFQIIKNITEDEAGNKINPKLSCEVLDSLGNLICICEPIFAEDLTNYLYHSTNEIFITFSDANPEFKFTVDDYDKISKAKKIRFVSSIN